MDLQAQIKAEALALGFQSVGFIPVAPPLSHPFYESWLDKGYGGEMAYLERHRPLKAHIQNIVPWAKTLVSLTFNYHPATPSQPQGGQVADYALGLDYHEILAEKLERLGLHIQKLEGKNCQFRGFVDSAPLMERDLAVQAGLGWVGKNANLISWKKGSWLFLAELALELDAETLGVNDKIPLHFKEHCGTCRACLDACPTGAIVEEKTVDARLCISYLTIELKTAIPEHLRSGMGNWIFGCDLCQRVCPWNNTAMPNPEMETTFSQGKLMPSLIELIELTDSAFSTRFRNTPLHRTKHGRILRNTAIALGNLARQNGQNQPKPTPDQPSPNAIFQVLQNALKHIDPLIRGASAWALGQCPQPQKKEILKKALQGETHEEVSAEIKNALSRI